MWLVLDYNKIVHCIYLNRKINYKMVKKEQFLICIHK